MKYLLLILLSLFSLGYTACNGVPLQFAGGHNFNCYSLCCQRGFVQSGDYNGDKCVPCASVGLLRCAVCALYALNQNGNNATYRCLQSQNIQNLMTVGSISVCSDNKYVLNNFSNYDKCVQCSDIIPNAKLCQIINKCKLTLAENIGNNCTPHIKVTECKPSFHINPDRNRCQVCEDMIFGCRTCYQGQCLACKFQQNFIKSQNGTCVCVPGTLCFMCPSNYMKYNASSSQCQCISGYVLQNDQCVMIPQCQGVNQSYSPKAHMCICNIGFVLTQNVCRQKNCSGNQMLLLQTGQCICKAGYTYVNYGCVLSGFKAVTKMYNLQYISNNYTTVTTQYEYQCACPVEYTFDNGRCIPCIIFRRACLCAEGFYQDLQDLSGCLSCKTRNLTGCISCHMFDQKCDRCIPGTALNKISACSSCMKDCSQCNAPDGDIKQCTECHSSAVMFGNPFQTCINCDMLISNCINCNKQTQQGIIYQNYECITCKYPYVPTANKKRCVCPGTNSSNPGCIPCQAGCISCAAGQCLQCLPGMVLHQDNNCYCQSYLQPNQFCQNCKNDLLGYNIQGCQTCDYEKTCSNCTKGYIIINQNCELCSRYLPGCIDCNVTNKCKACDSSDNFVLKGNECVCSQQYIYVQYSCRMCSDFLLGCLSCTGITSCTKCNASAHFQLINKTCACAVGFQRDQRNCIPCNQISQGCISCHTGNQTCLQCDQGYALNSSALCECAYGFVTVPGGCGQCWTVIPNCRKCNTTNCIQCKQYYELDEASGTCRLSSYLTSGCASKACKQCNNGTCTQCEIGAQMQFFGKCQCLPGYFLNSSFNCQKCDQNNRCAHCVTDQFCIQCVHDSFLPWTCTCPDGKYDRVQRPMCLDCPYYCKTCSNEDTCISCQQNLNRQVIGGKCICKPGFVSTWPGDLSKDPTKCQPVEPQ